MVKGSLESCLIWVNRKIEKITIISICIPTFFYMSLKNIVVYLACITKAPHCMFKLVGLNAIRPVDEQIIYKSLLSNLAIYRFGKPISIWADRERFLSVHFSQIKWVINKNSDQQQSNGLEEWVIRTVKDNWPPIRKVNIKISKISISQSKHIHNVSCLIYSNVPIANF